MSGCSVCGICVYVCVRVCLLYCTVYIRICAIVISASIHRYQLVRTRVIQLVDNWIGIKMSPEFRPSLYQTYIQLLDPSEPLLVSSASTPSSALDHSYSETSLIQHFL